MAAPYWYAQDDEVTLERRPAARRRGELGNRVTLCREPVDWFAGDCNGTAASCSDHARLRRAQRNMRLDQVGYVLMYGAQVCRTGAVFHILRHCDIDPHDLRRDDIARLEGAVVLMEDDTVITMYRNRRSYHQIHKKQKYERRRPAGRRRVDGNELAA
jgi:hypothetical protein